jgi:amino acid transporter
MGVLVGSGQAMAYVKAPIDKCWEIFCHFEKSHEYFPHQTYTEVLEFSPTSVLVNTFAGPVIVGGSLSLTITSKEQLVVPQSFDVVQLTVVVPTSNACGDVMTVAPILHSKLPVKVGLKLTSAEHSPASLVVVMLLGQTRVLYSMANDGLLPRKFFAAIHPKFRTPYKNTILVAFSRQWSVV